MRVNEKMRKALSILLCLCMLLQNAPVMAFAATTDNLCDHHTEHTAECGYREGSAGSACTHEHSEDCYAILDCKHTCGDECDDPCTHECTVENGCITMELDCRHVHGDCGYSEGTAEVPCGHVHDDACGYVAASEGTACGHSCADQGCTLNEDGTYTCLHAEHDETCGYVAPVEGVACGHTEHTDCGYAPATEGTPCTHVCEVKVNSSESCYKLLCSHKDGGHDEACGYVAAVGEQPCAYHCHICHVQELIDALPGVTGENAEAVMAQLTAIDDAKLALTAEELAQVDFTRYDAAVSSLNALAGQPGAEEPVPAGTSSTITITEAENGTVALEDSENTTKPEGTTVILTVTPAEGYELESLTIVSSENPEDPISTTKNENGTYSFVMPRSDVTVSATFKLIPTCTCTVKCGETADTNCAVCSAAGADLTAVCIAEPANAEDGVVEVSTEAELVAALEKGGNIMLMGDITVSDEYSFGYDITKNTAINLNGHTITGEGVFCLSGYEENIVLTISGNGTIKNTDPNFTSAICGCGTLNLLGGTIEGGTNTLGTTIMSDGWVDQLNTDKHNSDEDTSSITGGYVRELNCWGGIVTISGGHVEALAIKYGTIIISGGTFGFDPTAYLAEGYKTAQEDGKWVAICADGCEYTYTPDDGDTHIKYCSKCNYTGTENCSTEKEENKATCQKKAICDLCGESYGEVDGDAHNYGDWVSNGDNTHTRTCANDSTHTENGDCSGGTATCTTLAVCDICKTAYGEPGGHTAEPTYALNAEDSTKHDATYSCCGAAVTEAHTMDITTGKCACGAEVAVASVTIDGSTTYYETLDEAMAAANGKTATVKLLANGEITEQAKLNSDSNITLNLSGKTITAGARIFVSKDATLTIEGEGNYTSMKDWADVIYVDGTLNISGGNFSAAGVEAVLLQVWDGGQVNISGGSFTTTGSPSTPVSISGNVTVTGTPTFSGLEERGEFGIVKDGTLDLSGTTPTGWRVRNNYTTNGVLIGQNLKLPASGYALKLGDQLVTSLSDNGIIGTIVAHSHSYETKSNETYHWDECACGASTEKTGHSFGTDSECDVCKYVCTHENSQHDSYTDLTDTTHKFLCTICEQTIQQTHTYDTTTHRCVCGQVEQGWYTVTYPELTTLEFFVGLTVSPDVSQAGTEVTVVVEMSNEKPFPGMAVTAADRTKIPHTTQTNGGITTMTFEMPAQNVELLFKKPNVSLDYIVEGYLSYTGTAQYLIQGAEASNGTLQYRMDGGEWTREYPKATDVGTYSFEYRVLGDKGYMDIGPISVPVRIEKAEGCNITGDITVVNNVADTYTVDLSGYVPTFGSWGSTVTYALGEISFSDSGYYTSGAKIEDNKLILPINKVESTNVSSLGTVTVKITSQNFEESTLTLTVNRINHIHDWSYSANGNTITATCEGTIGSCADKEQSFTLNASDAGYSGNPVEAEVTRDSTDLSYTLRYTGTNYDSADAPTNVGDYTVTMTVGDKSVRDTFTISPKDISKVASCQFSLTQNSFTYNGEAPALNMTGVDSSVGSYTMQESTDYTVGTVQVNAGSHKLTVTGIGNYTGTAQLDYTITAKEVSITGAEIQAVTYDPNGYTLTVTGVTFDGVVDGENLAYTAEAILGNTNAFGEQDATVTVTLNNSNYNLATATYQTKVTINKAAATVTAAPTPNDLTYIGVAQNLINGGEATGGEMQYSTNNQTWSTTIPKGTAAGEYTVYYKVVGDANHSDTAVDSVEVTIAKAQAVITVDTTTITVTYGETVSLPTATTNFGNVVCDKTADDLVNAGTYTVTYTVAGTENFEGATKTLTVKVEQLAVAEPTVTGTYTYTGKELTAQLTGVESYMIVTSGNKGTNAGNYEVEVTLDGNHKWKDGSDGKVQWSIGKAKAEISVNTDPITITYGETVTLPTATTNFGDVACSKKASDIVNAGTYTVTYTVAGTDNYDGDTKSITVIVNAKAITVTADALSKTYGDADPKLTYKVEGLVNGDELTGELKRVAGENVGDYAIEQNTLTAGNNYRLTYTGAKLTINAKAITAADVKLNGSLTYNGREQIQPITVTEGITYEVSGNKATNAGAYELTVKGTGNYTGSVTLDWTIAKAKLTITADSKVIYIGEKLPTLTYTVSGLVGGDKLTKEPALTTNADADQAGSYTITAANADAGMNYAITYAGGTLTIMDKNTEVETKVETAALTEVPDGLKNTKFNTVEAIKQELTSRIVATSTGFVKENMAHYDVTLQFSLDGGETWILATEENFPTEGIIVTLPYPYGTNAAGYDFVVSHMFTVTSQRLGTTAGDVELPSVTETASGIRVTLKGLSPVTLAWRATEFDVKIAGTTNGTVSTNVSKATSGTEITVTVTPKYGYKMATLTVKDASGKSYAVSTDNSGKYYFTMPSADVTVTATFSKISSSTADTTNPKTGDDFQLMLWSSILSTSAIFLLAALADQKRKLIK